MLQSKILEFYPEFTTNRLTIQRWREYQSLLIKIRRRETSKQMKIQNSFIEWIIAERKSIRVKHGGVTHGLFLMCLIIRVWRIWEKENFLNIIILTKNYLLGHKLSKRGWKWVKRTCGFKYINKWGSFFLINSSIILFFTDPEIHTSLLK